MMGEVYKATLSDADKKHPHWYVVVLFLKDNKQCLVVPAFSEGGSVEDVVENAKGDELPEKAIAVKMDNSVEIKLKSKVIGHKAWWLTARWLWVAKETIIKGEQVGTMNPASLTRLAESLLTLDKARPGTFSRGVKEALSKV